MGKSVAETVLCTGLHPVPVSFSSLEKPGRTLKVGNTEIQKHGPSERESVLSSVFREFPDVIVVDYTVPDAVNANAELYCKLGAPICDGDNWWGQAHVVQNSPRCKCLYSNLSTNGETGCCIHGSHGNHGRSVSLEHFQVMESHQASKLDTSGTAKAIISCFQKLGVSIDMKQIKQIRDPKKQLEMVGVPEEHLSGRAFHLYHLTSPDET